MCEPLQQEDLGNNSDDSEAANEASSQRAAKLTQYQVKHLSFEREEARMIIRREMNKRRKRPTQIEELDLSDLLPAAKIQKVAADQASKEEDQAPEAFGRKHLDRDLVQRPLLNCEAKQLLVETISTNFIAKQAESSREERLSSLKQLANSFIVKSLTKSSELSFTEEERTFFQEQVCELNPDCLVELSKFWLGTIFFKIPSQVASQQSQATQYVQNMREIFTIIESRLALITGDAESFSEWV